MEINRMGPIGAEIVGVDVKTMDDATFDRIYKAWLDNNVICVRDQALEIDDYDAGLHLVQRLAGAEVRDRIARQMDYPYCRAP